MRSAGKMVMAMSSFGALIFTASWVCCAAIIAQLRNDLATAQDAVDHYAEIVNDEMARANIAERRNRQLRRELDDVAALMPEIFSTGAMVGAQIHEEDDASGIVDNLKWHEHLQSIRRRALLSWDVTDDLIRLPTTDDR